MAGVNVTVQGLKETQQYFVNLLENLSGPQMVTGMRDAAMVVYSASVKEAPADTGKLRASLVPEVKDEGNTVVGVVGSNLLYAPWVEEGSNPHWPPHGALAGWASRHGWTESAIRYIISVKGTQKHPYLEPAYKQEADRVANMIGDTVTNIVINPHGKFVGSTRGIV
jgi:hypothetical protein